MKEYLQGELVVNPVLHAFKKQSIFKPNRWELLTYSLEYHVSHLLRTGFGYIGITLRPSAGSTCTNLPRGSKQLERKQNVKINNILYQNLYHFLVFPLSDGLFTLRIRLPNVCLIMPSKITFNMFLTDIRCMRT
jgi:hypothetical protein